jgi:hypothetical protein
VCTQAVDVRTKCAIIVHVDGVSLYLENMFNTRENTRIHRSNSFKHAIDVSKKDSHKTRQDPNQLPYGLESVPKAVFRIRNILVRIRILGSVQ